jgi:hypothetical protein
MNKTQLIAAITTLLTGTAVVALYLNHLYKDMYTRFPAYSHKDLRKAYRMFLIKSVQGELGDIDDLTDEQMDTLFLEQCLYPITKI